MNRNLSGLYKYFATSRREFKVDEMRLICGQSKLLTHNLRGSTNGAQRGRSHRIIIQCVFNCLIKQRAAGRSTSLNGHNG